MNHVRIGMHRYRFMNVHYQTVITNLNRHVFLNNIWRLFIRKPNPRLNGLANYAKNHISFTTVNVIWKFVLTNANHVISKLMITRVVRIYFKIYVTLKLNISLFSFWTWSEIPIVKWKMSEWKIYYATDQLYDWANS